MLKAAFIFAGHFMTLSESQSRQELIDQQLAKSGWGVKSRKVVEEFLVRVAEDGNFSAGLQNMPFSSF